MSKQIQVIEYEGKFVLIGSDGYSTTQKRWNNEDTAEKARKREQKLEDEGKNSQMRWEY